jgi:hypothetical protein
MYRIGTQEEANELNVDPEQADQAFRDSGAFPDTHLEYALLPFAFSGAWRLSNDQPTKYSSHFDFEAVCELSTWLRDALLAIRCPKLAYASVFALQKLGCDHSGPCKDVGSDEFQRERRIWCRRCGHCCRGTSECENFAAYISQDCIRVAMRFLFVSATLDTRSSVWQGRSFDWIIWISNLCRSMLSLCRKEPIPLDTSDKHHLMVLPNVHSADFARCTQFVFMI